MNDKYFTISSASEGLYKDKGSKFIAYAYPVICEDEIKNRIEHLRKQHHSARHHCYAYRLGADKTIFRANDDGEPSNSAGKPILGQIQSFDLTNILIVVVRYFGGTLLGVGGLIQAYKNAANDALLNSEIVEKIVVEKITLKFEYIAMNEVMKIIKDEELEQIEQEFGLDCLISVNCSIRNISKIKQRFADIETVKLS